MKAPKSLIPVLTCLLPVACASPSAVKSAPAPTVPEGRSTGKNVSPQEALKKVTVSPIETQPSGNNTVQKNPDETSEAPRAASEDATDLKEAQALYSKANYEGVIGKLDSFERTFPASPLLTQAENLLGLSYLLTKQPALAVTHFKRAIDRNIGRNPALEPYLYYNLAKAQAETGLVEEAEASLAQVNAPALDADNRLKYHFLRANLYSRRKLHYEAAKELLKTSLMVQETSNSSDRKKALESALDQSLQEISGTAPMEDLAREFDSSPMIELILLRLGQRELALGNQVQGENRLRTLIARNSGSSYAAEAESLLKSNRSKAELNRNQIGVLLPLKGKFAAFGQRNLQSIELAFDVFNSQASGPGYTLVIEDSGDEPEQAVKALNTLVSKHHVAAVIGPLLSKGIDQVSKRAEELGVPMISLARNMGSAENYVFQGGLTLRLQAEAMARHAIEKLGMKRFAILTPQDKVGEETSQYFWDSVEALGGEIVGYETYKTGETDFRQAVDKLSGLYYTEARQREIDALADQRRALQIKKRNRKTEQYFNLKPIVDYDAVFIPDDAKMAAQIIPTFAYRDVEQVKFLGVSAWNSPELVARAQNYAEGALFVDAFSTDATSERSKKFLESYRQTFGQDPSTLDAVAYDAARVLETALNEAGGSFSRDDLAEKIRKTRNVHGATGQISFRDGQLFRDLQVLTVKNGEIVGETR